MTQAQISPTKIDAVKVDPVKIKIEPPKQEKRHRCFVGATLAFPLHYATVAGVTFHKYVTPPRWSEDGMQHNDRQRGLVMELTDSQIELVKSRVVNKVVRFGAGEAFLKNTDDVRYRVVESDQPLAKYLYLVKVDGDVPARWVLPDGKESPEPMA